MNETTSLYSQIKSGLWFVEQKTLESFNAQRIAVRAYPRTSQPDPATVPAQAPIPPTPLIDLGTMPTIRYLIGRRKELVALNRWLGDDACRFAAILGLGGQGKSSLAAWFVQEQCAKLDAATVLFPRPEHLDSQYVQDWPFAQPGQQENAGGPTEKFTQIIWRSLAQKPSCIELLQGLTSQLIRVPHDEVPANFDQLATMLFETLQQNRCLIVFDGVEALLAPTTQEEQAEAAAYEQLFRLFIERRHQSFLLVTSRLRPATLTHIQQQKQQVHVLELEGLQAEDSEEFLEAQGLATTVGNYCRLHEWYAGNPQMLSRAAELIHELFDGDVDAFLQEEIHFLGNIGGALAQQISHLSLLQQQMLQVLALAQQPLSRQALWTQLSSNLPKEAYYNALRDLRRAYLIQQTGGQFRATTLPTTFLAEHTTTILT